MAIIYQPFHKKLDVFSDLTRVYYFGNNDLVSLPNIFNKLPHLKKASFKSNHLTRLPDTFSMLEKLENLDISYNAIVKFPKPLLKLKALKFLNIERNKLQRFTLPEYEDAELYSCTLKFFEQLKHIQIKGNPIVKHVQAEDANKLLGVIRKEQVFRSLSEITPNKSMRVIVIGESGAGKTSVVQAVALDKYIIPSSTQQDHRHTIGIDHYYFPVQTDGKTILLHIWDHAGDDEYAMMNDLFITDRSLVWLVVNLAEYRPKNATENPKLYQDKIGKWLLGVMRHDLKPTLWIIGTHADSNTDTETAKKHISHWTNDLCVNYDATEVKFNVYTLTNTYSFKGRDQLLQALSNFTSSRDMIDLLPTEWEDAMHKLSKHAEDKLSSLSPDIPVIKISEVVEITQLHENIDAFLEYFHNVGDIYWLKYPSDPLLILNCNWIINLLKDVYHHEFEDKIKDLNYEDNNYVHTMRKDHGIIPKSLLKRLWKCDDADGETLFKGIMELFCTFDLASPCKNTHECFFFPYNYHNGKVN